MNLVPIAAVLAQAYHTTGRATEIFAAINENFAANTDETLPHLERMQDAVSYLTANGRLLLLIAAALKDPGQKGNLVFHQALGPILQQTRWQLLDKTGLVLRLGPFINRSNLRQSIGKLFLGRRVLRVMGSGGIRGRSWSRNLIEYEAGLQGARYILADLREAPNSARDDPSWLASALYKDLFPQPAQPPSIAGFAENRLIEALLLAWVPPSAPILVVIDHAGDANVAKSVKDYTAAFALAVAEGTLAGVKLVLIDGPPELDFTRYQMQLADDVVGPVTLDHLNDFFRGAAGAFFPGLPAGELEQIADTAVDPLKPRLPTGPSEDLALAVRDALESMAMK